MQKRLFPVRKKEIIFKDPFQRFIIQILLNLIIERTDKDKFNFSELTETDYSISVLTFYKKDFLHIKSGILKREIDEEKLNIKTIGGFTGIIHYLNLLAEYHYIIPAHSRRPQQIFHFEEFNKFTLNKGAEKLKLYIIYDLENIINLLENINDQQGDYVLETKRISFNIFNGVLKVDYINGGKRKLKIPTAKNSDTSLLLKSLLTKGYLTISEIRKLNPGINVENKISVLRGFLAIRRKNKKSGEYLGILIKHDKDRYVLVED